MIKISAVVITLNEEININDCLQTLDFADEIIIVDSRSSDQTVNIARKFTDKIFSIDWEGYARAKNYGIDKASYDWIFSIDADERVSEKLKNSILKVKSDPENFHGYRMPRKTWYLNRWIKGGGWYPDLSLRLFNKNFGRFSDVLVHESVTLKGNVSTLSGDLCHYSYRGLKDHLQRIEKYSYLCAKQWMKSGRKPSVPALIFRPWWEFFRKLILKKGYIDGKEGIIIAGFHGFYVFLKYAQLYALKIQREKSGKEEN